MKTRGLVAHRVEGRSYVYRAVIQEAQVSRGTADQLLERLFQGNLASLVHHLLTTRKVSRDKLVALERLIAERKRRR